MWQLCYTQFMKPWHSIDPQWHGMRFSSSYSRGELGVVIWRMGQRSIFADVRFLHIIVFDLLPPSKFIYALCTWIFHFDFTSNLYLHRTLVLIYIQHSIILIPVLYPVDAICPLFFSFTLILICTRFVPGFSNFIFHVICTYTEPSTHVHTTRYHTHILYTWCDSFSFHVFYSYSNMYHVVNVNDPFFHSFYLLF